MQGIGEIETLPMQIDRVLDGFASLDRHVGHPHRCSSASQTAAGSTS
jgi:hypothetical protein